MADKTKPTQSEIATKVMEEALASVLKEETEADARGSRTVDFVGPAYTTDRGDKWE